MGRPKDEHYWNQVTKLEDGVLQCKHCGHKFKGGVSRIKAHVDRKQGQGITACSVDTNSVRDNEGVDNNITAGSINSQGTEDALNSLEVAGRAREMIDNNIVGSSNRQNETAATSSFQGWAAKETLVGSGNSPFEIEISLLKELVHDLTCERDDIEEQLQWLESGGKKRKRHVDDWLNEVECLKSRADHMNTLMDQFGSIDLFGLQLQQLIEEVQKHKEQKPLVLSNELVGKSFETNIKKVWELLGDDQVFIIGVHGMGGVGKTSLVTHMEREITRRGTFKHVFWVTVSQDFSIFKLQNDIAKRIAVKLDEDDERIRAADLSLALETKEKSVLILDDVWKNIDLQKVGIPLRVNGIKLILTSRLEHVCHQMDCPQNHIIRVMPLLDHEAWELFLLKLGYHGMPATLPPKVLEIARSVAKECDGLPLGISAMAKTMKGVQDIHRWRHALNKLRNSVMGEEMEEDFKVLKLSYDNLFEKNMQNCFLYWALYNGNAREEFRFSVASREEFIMMLVDEGLINGMSLEEMFDEGHAILEKLIDHSLLLWNDDIHMHGLVREMACHILNGSHRYMVKCNKGLTEIPHMQEWTADLEKLSLSHNKIQEIPASTSPRCTRLSSFSFRGNPLSRIPDCFFSHMNALTILDLSYNQCLTCLPNSVSNLRALISLLLRGCKSLKDVPPLGELQALLRLDISGTSIHEVPKGLETLINLKWLDLSGNDKLTFVPKSVLSNLTNIQCLNLQCGSVASSCATKVNVEDVQGMSKLECFACSFSDCQNFNRFVQRTQDRGYGPKSYYLRSGISFEFDWDIGFNPFSDEGQIVRFEDCEEFVHWLPRDLAKLYISHNKQWRCLCDVLSFDGPSSLRISCIEYCPKLESLFCLSGSCPLCIYLQNLDSLSLENLESLSLIWKENNANITRILCSGDAFSHLRHLKISNCHKMKVLLTPGSLPQLKSLVTITVECCNSMEEIFAVKSNENDEDGSIIILPILKRLELRNLPQLKTLCRGVKVFGSSPILIIHGCSNLERLPTVQGFQVYDFDYRHSLKSLNFTPL